MIEVATMDELNTTYWFDAQLETPAVRRSVGRVWLIMDLDLSVPINSAPSAA